MYHLFTDLLIHFMTIYLSICFGFDLFLPLLGPAQGANGMRIHCGFISRSELLPKTLA
jgi:hypothetical protein